MNERIKELRKALGLTQQEFADKIGVKRNSLANYETGRNTPIEAIFKSICDNYNVNEEWLRNGTGEMFINISRDDEIASFIGDVQFEDGFKKRFISMLSKLNESDWGTIEKMVDELPKEKD